MATSLERGQLNSKPEHLKSSLCVILKKETGPLLQAETENNGLLSLSTIVWTNTKTELHHGNVNLSEFGPSAQGCITHSTLDNELNSKIFINLWRFPNFSLFTHSVSFNPYFHLTHTQNLFLFNMAMNICSISSQWWKMLLYKKRTRVDTEFTRKTKEHGRK